MIGRTLGNYRIIEQIGIGGMATVYKAYDPDTDRYVAIKILPHQFSQDPTFRQRFQREAKAIAKLEHIHILPIFAYGEEDGIAYMAMRYLKAGTLTDRIRHGPLPLRETGRLLHQIACALDHAHAHGVLHRDVKPSNVLLDADGNAFLTDFGIAKMVEATLDLTAGGILGTPAYMSPEQCRGSRELTPASDIFSLGIILYEMVTGRTPFQAETPIALIHMQLNEPMPPPCKLRPDLPEDVQRVILKALAREPESRYQTCEAMATAFDQVIAQAGAESLQPAVPVPTAAGGSSVPTSPAIEEATILHRAAERTEIVPVPFWRRIPGWALGLIGLLVIVGLIGGALVVGLIFTGRDNASTEAGMSKAESEPTLPVSEVEVDTEISPTQPLAEATAVPPTPVTPGEPPTEGHEVTPCDWHGLGPGLCITPLQSDQPRKILTEADLEITSAGSWSPDGQRIAFSAVEPGGRHDRDQTIRIVNSDGTGLTDLPTENNDTQPGWSPDGEWLAFHSSGSLAIMHPDGSKFTLIYERPSGGCVVNPQWSPDSRSVVFYLIRNCEWDYPLTREIWVVTADGKTAIPIASFTDKNADCSWTEVAFSPDGGHVAYHDDQCRAWLARADGSGEAERVDEFPYWWTGMVHPQWGKEFVPENALIVEPEKPAQPREAISTLKMVVENCEETEPSQICIRNLETNQVIQITDDLEFGLLEQPNWSPDGQQLIFSAGSDPEVLGDYDRKLYTINADGSDLRQITHGQVNDVDPVWSHDGQWIAFHRNCGLWLVRPDGSEAQELVANSEEFCAIGIAWKPDSRAIAFWNAPGDEAINRTIWVINRDGSGQQVIHSFEQPMEWGTLAWSPDGQHIVFWYEAGGQGQGLLIKADGSGEPAVIKNYEDMPWHWFPWHWPPGSTIYDDFNDPVFDGKLDMSLWNPSVIPPSSIEQREGVLVISLEPGAGKSVDLFSYENLKSNQFNFVESKMLLSSDRTGQDGDISFSLVTTLEDGRDLIFSCIVYRGEPVQVGCEVYGSGESGSEYSTAQIITNYDVWHTVRIEIDPEINAIFYIDGEQVGFYRPNDAEEIKDRTFETRLAVWSPGQDGIKAQFDDVRIGQLPASMLAALANTLTPTATIDTDPTLYDDFNNPSYDGTFDSTRWIPTNGCENTAQNEGVMVFKDSCDLIAGKPTIVTLDQLELFEARVKVASDHNGGTVTQEIDFITHDLPGEEWWAICGIIAQSEEVNSFFRVVNAGLNENDEISRAIPAQYDQWYTIRFEVDSNTAAFSCYVDDQLMGSIIPKDISLLKEARFERIFEAARYPGAFATTYADDVRIKP